MSPHFSPRALLVPPSSSYPPHNSKIQIMYSIKCERCRARAKAAVGAEKGRWVRWVVRWLTEKGLLSRRRGHKRKGPVGAPRTRGKRSGKEMRKSVINWRWDYSRRALRRQAARRTTWKVLPDTFCAPPSNCSPLSIDASSPLQYDSLAGPNRPRLRPCRRMNVKS